MKDIEIIAGIKEGNPEFEELLFNKYDSRIRFIVYSKLYNYKEDARDLLQDIRMSVLMSIRNGNFKLEDEFSLGAYIYGISMNKIVDFFKRNNRMTEYQNKVLKDTPIMYNEKMMVEEEEIKSILFKVLKNLKEKYQEVLYLKFFDELSVAEISDKINLPPRRVSERLNYALKLIKIELMKTKYFNK